MRTIIFFLAIFTVIIVSSCEKGELTEEVSQDVDNTNLARKYKLKKGCCGEWEYKCKNGDTKGYASSKADAKSLAEVNCPNGEASCAPPFYTILTVNNGLINMVDIDVDETQDSDIFADDFPFLTPLNYLGINILDKENSIVFHSSNDISYFEMMYWLGEEIQQIADERKVITHLTFIGVYNGGTTINQLMQNHNLSSSDFYNLVNRNFTESFELDIDSETGLLNWTF